MDLVFKYFHFSITHFVQFFFMVLISTRANYEPSSVNAPPPPRITPVLQNWNLLHHSKVGYYCLSLKISVTPLQSEHQCFIVENLERPEICRFIEVILNCLMYILHDLFTYHLHMALFYILFVSHVSPRFGGKKTRYELSMDL